jgi:hypothetical protein
MGGLGSVIKTKRRRLDGTEVGCVCAIFEFLSFIIVVPTDRDDSGSSSMIEY